jgi:NAD(P)-dependent dehydrogenase (short-subunit alcohol dehydrogenase family)
VKEKICLVTGGTSGVGMSIAMGLAKKGAKVIIVGQNVQKAKIVRNKIVEASHNEKIDYHICDLSSQQAIRNFVSQFQKKYDQLHVLSNNAGVLLLKKQLTIDGIEKNWAVDYLSHFLLTGLLTDQLKRSSPSRIITVAGSPRMLKKTRLNFDNSKQTTRYNGINIAVRAGLARVLFTFELARRLEQTNVTANAFHPGLVRSKLTRAFPMPLRIISGIAQPFLSKESKTGIYLASSPAVENVSGKFFSHKKPISFDLINSTGEIRRRLWNNSLDFTGLKDVF